MVKTTTMDFAQIVLNFNPYFFTFCKAISSGAKVNFFWVIIRFLQILLHLKFTLDFSTIIVGSFDIRSSLEVFPTEASGPEITAKL